MGIQDRDWYREEQRRRRKRGWRWRYRLRADLPWWLREWLRLAVFFAILGLLYRVWIHFH